MQALLYNGPGRKSLVDRDILPTGFERGVLNGMCLLSRPGITGSGSGSGAVA